MLGAFAGKIMKERKANRKKGGVDVVGCRLGSCELGVAMDYKGHARGLNWLKVYGMNSITTYLLGEGVTS